MGKKSHHRKYIKPGGSGITPQVYGATPLLPGSSAQHPMDGDEDDQQGTFQYGSRERLDQSGYQNLSSCDDTFPNGARDMPAWPRTECQDWQSSGNTGKCSQERAMFRQQQNQNIHRNSHVIKSVHHFERSGEWWALFTVVVILSFGTRLYKIDWPSHICWDETHFGKMGSWYINRTFFFDVHPPLGKMLIGLAGSLTGYNGSFHFSKPGNKYDDVPYVGMRVFCASLGAALAPLSYGTVWELTHSLTAAMLAASLIIFDTGLLTLCQYILLDPPLLFFIMASTYCLVKFLNQGYRPFQLAWWLWLSLTGVSLACAMGVKFVGLFVILLAGVATIRDLWRVLGDLSLSMFSVFKHFIARFACLVVLPVIVYLIFYALHFHRLTKSGSGDGFFSSAFQSQLEGNALFNANMPAEVAYGSVITLKNYRTGGGYLHSHLHLYPENVGARQQQVTTYGHKDDNNKWMLKKHDRPANTTEEPELVMNGDLVRLEHVSTRRNLHSHRVPAPITQKHHQVTCYGNDGEGDSNDVFRLEVSGARGHAPLFTVRSTFRLVHAGTGCAVQSHSKQLPKWAWEQMEVTCNPNARDKKTLWNVEQVIDERLPNRSFTVYAPSFLDKVVESHAVMAQGNSGLKPKEGESTSQPWQWPINYKGQPFSGGDQRVYLLGNPVLWWGSLVITALYLLMAAIHAVRRQRMGTNAHPSSNDYADRMLGACSWLMVGWLLHYVPFWFMGRVLYFHHYFPSLLYNFMLSGVMLDYLITRLSGLAGDRMSWVVHHVLIGVVLSVIVYSFYVFSPLSYGMTGPLAEEKESEMYGLKWLDSWDI